MPPAEHDKLLAEGEAALLLAESMLLALVETRLLGKEQVIEAIETVIATKRAMVNDGEAPRVSAAAIGLLTNIANSIAAANGGAGVDEPT